MSPRSRGEPRGQRHLRGHADGPRGRILGAFGPEFEAPRVRPHHLTLSMRCRPGTVDSRSEIEQLWGATSAHRLASVSKRLGSRAFPRARESHQFAAVASHLIGSVHALQPNRPKRGCAVRAAASARGLRIRSTSASSAGRKERAVPFCLFQAARAEPGQIRCGWGCRRAAGRRRGSTAAPCRARRA